jgi:hypothetical protein
MFGLFKGSKPVIPPEDSWTIAQAENNGRPMFLRINVGLRPIAGEKPFDHRFGVAVPLLAPDANGLPTHDEAESLNIIEDDLIASFQSSRQTLLAVVITTSGFREFVFYTSVARDIAPAMELLRARVTSHELQFYVKPDKKWDVFQSFLH